MSQLHRLRIDACSCAASAGDAASAAVLLGGVPGLEPAPTRCGQDPPPPMQPEARLAAISNALNQPAGGQQTPAEQKLPKLFRPRSVLRLALCTQTSLRTWARSLQRALAADC